jgi:hypothetical protein
MLQLNRELSPEELDAMEAQDAAAPSSPAQPPATPLAMGPIAQLDSAREYTAEELDLYEEANSFTPDELDQKLVASVFDDPTYIPNREEFFEAKDAKARLKAEGKLPGLLDYAATGAGAFIQTLGEMANELVDDPGDFLARSPATMIATAKKSWRNTNDVARWLRQANASDPIGRYEDTGEFIYGQTGAGMDDAAFLAAKQLEAIDQGRKIRPATEEDLKDDEFDRFLAERTRQAELEEWVANTAAPTEFITSLVTGRNQMEQPMQATSDIAGGLLEATNVATMAVPFSAGAKSLGLSRLAKAGGSRTARIFEKTAGAGADAAEAGAARLQSIIEKGTRLSPENQTKIAKWAAAGGVGGAAFGMDTDVPVLSQVQDVAKVLGGAYLLYKGGVGTLRTVQKVAGPTSVALRIAADPADGLDAVAQASVATKLNAFPELSPVREVLENPTRFRAIESTPARIAADPRFGPQTRAIADSLANPAIVQGVRGASAVAGGAIKGAAANAPFVALALNAEEEQAAGNMLGMGAAFGAAGGAASRFTGLKQRRAEARSSDIARMLIDVELAGGDVGKFAQTYSPQQLGDLASMQGFFRDKVEFVPLNKTDFDLNTKALGGTGAAGLHVQAAPGEKARIFINLDAKREGIVPHELGHALIKSGALGGMQADSIRAFTTRRYTQAGVEARAREYATTLIQNENAAKFPGQNLAISQDAIQAKMDELGQSGLLRGDTDPLDWARDEIFAEDFRQASQSMDFAAIRRNLPAEGSWLGSMEGILGAQANALSISGVRIDPVTGQPDPLFKTNPILDTDPVLKKQVGQYLNNYRNWINHPDQTKARGVRVAPTARPQDLVNNPLVTFHDYGGGVLANEFARIDPATGQAILRDQRDINAETAKRQQQVKALVGSKLLPATDPNLGPKKTADGRVTVRGRTLPQQFDFLNGFAQHQRTFARQLETAAANGESLMVRYHSIGTGDSGSFRVRNLGNLEAITREVIPWGWELTSKGNLLTSVLDLTQFRNRALKAINAGDPTLGRLYNNDLKAIEADLKQWMENHRQDLPGSNKIGEQRRDAINSLIGIATNVNKGANPFSGKIAGPSSAIKQFRLDRLDAATGTGRTGFHFDYDKANGNLLPEIPTPLPDLSRDLPAPKGQAMPDAVGLKSYQEAKRAGNDAELFELNKTIAGEDFAQKAKKAKDETKRLQNILVKRYGKKDAERNPGGRLIQDAIYEATMLSEELVPIFDKVLANNAANAAKAGFAIDTNFSSTPKEIFDALIQFPKNQATIKAVSDDVIFDIFGEEGWAQYQDGMVISDHEMGRALPREFKAFLVGTKNGYEAAVYGKELNKVIQSRAKITGVHRVVGDKKDFARQIAGGESEPLFDASTKLIQDDNEIFYLGDIKEKDIEIIDSPEFVSINDEISSRNREQVLKENNLDDLPLIEFELRNQPQVLQAAESSLKKEASKGWPWLDDKNSPYSNHNFTDANGNDWVLEFNDYLDPASKDFKRLYEYSLTLNGKEVAKVVSDQFNDSRLLDSQIEEVFKSVNPDWYYVAKQPQAAPSTATPGQAMP